MALLGRSFGVCSIKISLIGVHAPRRTIDASKSHPHAPRSVNGSGTGSMAAFAARGPMIVHGHSKKRMNSYKSPPISGRI